MRITNMILVMTDSRNFFGGDFGKSFLAIGGMGIIVTNVSGFLRVGVEDVLIIDKGGYMMLGQNSCSRNSTG